MRKTNSKETAPRDVTLISRGPGDTVDHENVERTARRFELQTQLFLQRRKE